MWSEKKDEGTDGILKSHITDIEQAVNPKGKTMYRIEDCPVCIYEQKPCTYGCEQRGW